MKKENSSPLLYSVDEKPGFGLCLMMALQHVMLLVAPITITPIVVFRAAGVAPAIESWAIFASLIASAITSYIQIKRVGRIGSGYLIFMGTSGAFISIGISAVQIGGIPLLATLCVLSAPFQIFFAMKLGWFRKIITQAVGGVVIMLIVVAIIPVVADMLKPNPAVTVPASTNITITLFTFFLIMGLIVFGNARMRLWSPLIGLVTGSIFAWIMGAMDFTLVKEASWIGLPSAGWPGMSFTFPPEFISLYLSFIIVTLVGAVETYGDTIAIQKISERNKKAIDYNRVQGSLYIDGIGNALAGALGTLPNTSYSYSISIIELTGVASRRVGYFAVVILGSLAFLPKLGALISSIPGPVFAAFLFILLSMLFKIGLKLCMESGFSTENGYIVGISFLVGYFFNNGFFFAEHIPPALAPFLENGMVVGGFCAILLSILFSLRVRKRAQCHLTPHISSLNQLHEFINSYGSAHQLTPDTTFKLNLAAEEAFTHFLNSRSESEIGGEMVLKLGITENKILAELIDGSDAEQLEELDIDHLRSKARENDARSLGLVLLDGIAKELHAQKFGPVNYLSFTIEKE